MEKTNIDEFQLFVDQDLQQRTEFNDQNMYVISSKKRIERTIKKFHAKINDAVILDIGASPFYFLDKALKNGAKKAHGIYFSNDSHPLRNYDKLYSNNGEIDLHHVDALHSDLPFSDNSLDIVTAMEVFEHFNEYPSKLLSEITRVLKPKGTLVITVPNVSYYTNLIKLLIGRNVYYRYRSDPYGRHSHEYTRSQLNDLLTLSICGKNGNIDFIPNSSGSFRGVMERLLSKSPLKLYFSQVIYGEVEVDRFITPENIIKPDSLWDESLSTEC